MLHLQTVSPQLLGLIQKVSKSPQFDAFRLVGGTALSLYLGHRISIDADFFTESHFDKKEIEQAIIHTLPNAIKVNEAAYGFTWVHQDIKIDFYDWKVPFIVPSTNQNSMRLAGIEDVAAYKLDAIVGRKTEKDYRDVAELLKHFSLNSLLGFYQQKFPFNSPRIALDHLSAHATVGLDASVVLLKNDAWDTIQSQIDTALIHYFDKIQIQKQQESLQREQQLQALLARKKK